MAFSSDGQRIASCARDQIVRIWDADTGEQIRELTGHKHNVFGVAFSPDDRYIVSGSWDGTIKVWEAESGRLINSIEHHTSRVYAVSYSPDGRYILSSSADRYTLLRRSPKQWASRQGQLLTPVYPLFLGVARTGRKC